MRKFAERLKELREEKELTIHSLSQAIQISDSSIHRWEKNQSDITSDYLIILAKFFGVTVGYLVGTEN